MGQEGHLSCIRGKQSYWNGKIDYYNGGEPHTVILTLAIHT